jgi:hypothetical protein
MRVSQEEIDRARALSESLRSMADAAPHEDMRKAMTDAATWLKGFALAAAAVDSTPEGMAVQIMAGALRNIRTRAEHVPFLGLYCEAVLGSVGLFTDDDIPAIR